MYHEPVMLEEAIEALAIKPDGHYADCTFGGGGHSAAILERLDGGRLLAFDQDPASGKGLNQSGRFILVRQNFRYLRQYARYFDMLPLDGIIADLGVSSHQFDANERGFSFRTDGPLDMRMNPEQELKASDVLHHYEEAELARIFREYSDMHQSWKVARALVSARMQNPLERVADLVALLEPFSPASQCHKFLAQVFQALRMEVNHELEVLRELLDQAPGLLRPGGRLVIISFHSGEDRLVKEYTRNGWEKPDPANLYGGRNPLMVPVFKKGLSPGKEEMERNNRSRSARMRVAEKC